MHLISREPRAARIRLYVPLVRSELSGLTARHTYTSYHAMPGYSQLPLSTHIISQDVAHATILTLFPAAFLFMSRPSLSALCSIDADAGTEAVMTSTPLLANTSVIPRQ